jgi:hypothetical protein
VAESVGEYESAVRVRVMSEKLYTQAEVDLLVIGLTDMELVIDRAVTAMHDSFSNEIMLVLDDMFRGAATKAIKDAAAEGFMVDALFGRRIGKAIGARLASCLNCEIPNLVLTESGMRVKPTRRSSSSFRRRKERPTSSTHHGAGRGGPGLRRTSRERYCNARQETKGTESSTGETAVWIITGGHE